MNDTATLIAPASAATLSRAECEEFFFHEAALLDEWRLDEWYALFTEDSIYEVPTAGSSNDADSAAALFYIADDYARLHYRVERLKKPSAHSEWPRSIAARLVSNVRIIGSSDAGIEVASIFVTYRSKNDITDVFVGHMRYVLRIVEGRIKIASKRVFLDMNSLKPHGRVSIIL